MGGGQPFPWWLAWPFSALGLAHLPAARAPAPGTGDGISDTAPERGAVLLVLASLVGYVALLSTAGFALAAFGLLLILVHRLGGYGWRRSIGLAVGLALATHVVFVVWLGIPLPAGPPGSLSSHGGPRAPDVAHPDRIILAVAGGDGRHSAWMPAWNVCQGATERVEELPSSLSAEPRPRDRTNVPPRGASPPAVEMSGSTPTRPVFLWKTCDSHGDDRGAVRYDLAAYTVNAFD